MYYYLISSMKRRIILELKDSFSRHPQYNKIVPFIENKYSFESRPQFGIVVKGSNANKVQLSADNYLGTVVSHVMLAYINQPAYMLEWVREDLKAVENNGGVFPTPPGVYYLECLKAPTNEEEAGVFAIDRFLTQTDEVVMRFKSGIEKSARLEQVPVEGTLRLWEGRDYDLKEGVDFTVDYTTGDISLNTRFAPGSLLTADYRYLGPSTSHEFHWNEADFKSLPGVVLAFGKRVVTGDKVAVVVYQDACDTANAYGGKFEITFDMDVISLDPMQMEEIADFSIMSLWGEKKALLDYEGIHLLDVNMGGETEETYDEEAETMYYMASLSVQLQADWEIHVPLPLTISRGNISNHLVTSTSPFIIGRNYSYERIG